MNIYLNALLPRVSWYLSSNRPVKNKNIQETKNTQISINHSENNRHNRYAIIAYFQ